MVAWVLFLLRPMSLRKTLPGRHTLVMSQAITILSWHKSTAAM
jgi:hypothetical protein